MPRADAGVGLPGPGQNAGRLAAFNVINERLALGFIQHLGVHHGFVMAMHLEAGVIEVRGEVQADGVVDPVQRQHVVIEINHVRVVVIPELLGAEEKFDLISLVRHAGPLGGIPVPDQFFAGHMVLGVEVLGIETVPPQAFAVGLGELAIIGHAGEGAGGVRTLRHFIPGPGVGGMNAYGEAQAVFARCGRPAADEVFVRSDGDGIPGLIFGIEVVEVVVMGGQGHEVFRAVGLVKGEQFVRVKIRRLPLVDDVLETVGGGMAVGRQMQFIGALGGDIQIAGIPVPLLGFALGAPVRPDAELGVPEPVRRLILRGQGFPRGLKRPGRDVGKHIGARVPGIRWVGLGRRGHAAGKSSSQPQTGSGDE